MGKYKKIEKNICKADDGFEFLWQFFFSFAIGTRSKDDVSET